MAISKNLIYFEILTPSFLRRQESHQKLYIVLGDTRLRGYDSPLT